MRGIVSSGSALYYQGQWVVRLGRTGNYGPLPLVVNGVTIETNADGPAEMLAYANHALQYDAPCV